jgi:hypothetical protein
MVTEVTPIFCVRGCMFQVVKAALSALAVVAKYQGNSK